MQVTKRGALPIGMICHSIEVEESARRERVKRFKPHILAHMRIEPTSNLLSALSELLLCNEDPVGALINIALRELSSKLSLENTVQGHLHLVLI